MTHHSLRNETGSASIELVILAPLFGLLVGLVILAGRTETARANVEGVAHAAARDLTLSRNPAGAIDHERAIASAALHEGSSLCKTMSWQAQLNPGDVTVTITCTVNLAKAGLLPVPGTMRVAATSTEPLDPYREAS